jgi:hypothetical protein
MRPACAAALSGEGVETGEIAAAFSDAMPD